MAIKNVTIQKESKRAMATHMCYCPTDGIIDLLSKKWTLCVINALSNHEKLRYKELIEELRVISPKTLTKTLKDLEEIELVKRTSYNVIPPKVEYSLSKKGMEFREVIYPLLSWISKNTEKESLACCSCVCESCSENMKIEPDVSHKIHIH